ncbi:CAP domain-containing protein [Streptomyces sp. NPDC055912]|uniref:CAP domain-containing protein n=1 Tax=Streptomyces sp. NPDC055912 TaxID=3345660 RepID=UPI0035DD440C
MPGRRRTRRLHTRQGRIGRPGQRPAGSDADHGSADHRSGNHRAPGRSALPGHRQGGRIFRVPRRAEAQVHAPRPREAVGHRARQGYPPGRRQRGRGGRTPRERRARRRGPQGPDGRRGPHRGGRIRLVTVRREHSRGTADAAAVMDAWMHCHGHRANTLNCGFTEIGVGFSTDGGPWSTQGFGTPY